MNNTYSRKEIREILEKEDLNVDVYLNSDDKLYSMKLPKSYITRVVRDVARNQNNEFILYNGYHNSAKKLSEAINDKIKEIGDFDIFFDKIDTHNINLSGIDTTNSIETIKNQIKINLEIVKSDFYEIFNPIFNIIDNKEFVKLVKTIDRNNKFKKIITKK